MGRLANLVLGDAQLNSFCHLIGLIQRFVSPYCPPDKPALGHLDAKWFSLKCFVFVVEFIKLDRPDS